MGLKRSVMAIECNFELDILCTEIKVQFECDTPKDTSRGTHRSDYVILRTRTLGKMQRTFSGKLFASILLEGEMELSVTM
jgi:hypothetical protein